VPVTKLSAESIYLNNFSKMRVNLAVHALNPIVAQEILEHENTATSSTQTYILKCSRLFQIFNSEDPLVYLHKSINEVIVIVKSC
jgi:hypothetical protein